MSFADLATTLWPLRLGNEKLKPSAVYSYNLMLKNHLIPAFGTSPLGEITSAQVMTFFSRLGEQAAPPNKVRNLRWLAALSLGRYREPDLGL